VDWRPIFGDGADRSRGEGAARKAAARVSIVAFARGIAASRGSAFVIGVARWESVVEGEHESESGGYELCGSSRASESGAESRQGD
jgi:hypothetical protein